MVSRTNKKKEKIVLERVVTLEYELREETGLGIIEAAKERCPKIVKELLQIMANIALKRI